MENDSSHNFFLPGLHKPVNKIICRKTVILGDIKKSGIMDIAIFLTNTDKLVPRSTEVQGDTLGT